jgi:hypothetical protein
MMESAVHRRFRPELLLNFLLYYLDLCFLGTCCWILIILPPDRVECTMMDILSKFSDEIFKGAKFVHSLRN